jgi:flagellar protein FliJ
MRRFRFRLQAILDLRLHEEEQRRLELGAATVRRNTIQRAIDERRNRRIEVLGYPSGMDGATDLEWRRSAEEYAFRLTAEIRELEVKLMDAERERVAAAKRYGQARQKAELLQKLHDRREKDHRYVEGRTEQNRLDEVAQYIYNRGGL